MKKTLLLYIALPLAALLTLALLVQTVYLCIPQKEAVLRETEEVKVSSSVKTVLGDGASYACLVTGRLFNSSDDRLDIAYLEIVMADEGGVELKIRTKEYILPARASINLLERLENPTAVHTVRSVTAVYADGHTEELLIEANKTSPLRPLLFGLLTLASGGLTAFVAAQGVYAAEEERLRKNSSES